LRVAIPRHNGVRAEEAVNIRQTRLFTHLKQNGWASNMPSLPALRPIVAENDLIISLGENLIMNPTFSENTAFNKISA
jgi:hypothetical protein